MQQELWLPLTDYAIRTGMSISTLRRKIKANAIDFKKDDGRYLVRCDAFAEDNNTAFYSSDGAEIEPAPTQEAARQEKNHDIELRMAENELRWRAIDARVSGLAKKLEIFSEQISELNMMVKIFEEKLDNEA